jgi:hypothetical protein
MFHHISDQGEIFGRVYTYGIVRGDDHRYAEAVLQSAKLF